MWVCNDHNTWTAYICSLRGLWTRILCQWIYFFDSCFEKAGREKKRERLAQQPVTNVYAMRGTFCSSAIICEPVAKQSTTHSTSYTETTIVKSGSALSQLIQK
jgi:hypothetical protein